MSTTPASTASAARDTVTPLLSIPQVEISHKTGEESSSKLVKGRLGLIKSTTQNETVEKHRLVLVESDHGENPATLSIELSLSTNITKVNDREFSIDNGKTATYRLKFAEESVVGIQMIKAFELKCSELAHYQMDQEFRGKLVIADESSGAVLGVMNQQLNEDKDVRAEDTTQLESGGPVLIRLPESNEQSASVQATRTIGDRLVSTSEAISSRLIEPMASFVCAAVSGFGNAYVKQMPKTSVRLAFTPLTTKPLEKLAKYSSGLPIMASTVKTGVTGVAKMVGRGLSFPARYFLPSTSSALGEIIGKSLTAADILSDSILASALALVNATADTSSQIAHHSFGTEAGQVSNNAWTLAKNVALFYVDTRGIVRKAVIETAKGAVLCDLGHGESVIFEAPDSAVDSQGEDLNMVKVAGTHHEAKIKSQ